MNFVFLESRIKLSVPEAFPFPFPPYDIRVGFMKNVYECLESRGIGIFESPTGTVRQKIKERKIKHLK